MRVLRAFQQHRVPFDLRPLSVTEFRPEQVLEVVREVVRLPRPVVVHAFLPLESGRSPAAEAFVQALRADLPPLPPSLFAEPMGVARVRFHRAVAGSAVCGVWQKMQISSSPKTRVRPDPLADRLCWFPTS